MEIKAIKIFCLWCFTIMSFICFSVECYEIASGNTVSWSDHLHNLIDHIMYLVVNYIGFNVVSNKYKLNKQDDFNEK